MKKAFYILILMLALTGCGCGEPVTLDGCGQMDGLVNGDAQAEFPEMGEIHLQIAEDPGDEYKAGWCTVNWTCDDGATPDDLDDVAPDESDGNAFDKAGYAMGFVTGEEVTQVTLPVEIKLRGNSTREVDKKAYTIKFEEDESLLGMAPGRKWALVSNPFDKSLLRPAVGLAYAKALGIEYTSDFRLCKVWLNDDYMGVYTAMEPVEAGEGRVEISVTDGESGDAAVAGDEEQCDFLLERNLGRYEDDKIYIDSSLGMRFEFNEPEEPSEAQMEQCYEMLAAAEEAICSGEYEQYAALIDVDSFVNYYIFQEMIKDVDFAEYSTRYYFEDGILHAGPPWDLDLTIGNVSTEKEEFKFASYNNVDGAGDAVYQVLSGAEAYGSDSGNLSGDEQSGAGSVTAFGGSAYGLWAAYGDYYYWLCRDPWFMELVQQRWLAVREITENLAEDNELGENLIDRYLAAYEEDLSGNFQCWSVSEPAHMSEWQEPADTYAENVEMLRMWLIKRASYLDSQFGPFIYTPELAVQ